MTALIVCIAVVLFTAAALWWLWRKDDEAWRLAERDDYTPPALRRGGWGER